MELIKLETGIDVVHVPYKGLGGATADVIGGHVAGDGRGAAIRGAARAVG